MGLLPAISHSEEIHEASCGTDRFVKKMLEPVSPCHTAYCNDAVALRPWVVFVSCTILDVLRTAARPKNAHYILGIV